MKCTIPPHFGFFFDVFECGNICLSESLSVANSVQQVMFFYIQSNKSYFTYWTEHNVVIISSWCLPDSERADL